MKKNWMKWMSNSKGSSAMEWIIMIVLAGSLIIALQPSILKLMDNTKRFVDMYNANQLARTTMQICCLDDTLSDYRGIIKFNDDIDQDIEIAISEELEKIPSIMTYQGKEFVIHVTEKAIIVTDDDNRSLYPIVNDAYKRQ